jgi:Ribonuclease G/E
VIRSIRVACSPGERLVALVQDESLLEIRAWRPGAPDGVGDLYRGRITTRAAAMAGRFVELGGQEGFLPDSECPDDPPSGTWVGVRITRSAQGGKGPRLSAKLPASDLALTAQAPPGLVLRGPHAVSRLAARHPEADILVDDVAVAASLYAQFGTRVRRVEQAFSDALADEVAGLAEAEVPLPLHGARLQITPTPALTAIDVDAGGAGFGGGSKTATLAAFNAHVLPLLARQIRLRNLSGAILVDLAGLSAKRRRALAPALAAALEDDPLRPRLLGFTALGLAEIVRPRIHPPWHEILAGPHAAGLAALRRAVSETIGGHPITLRAAPAVAECLQSDSAAWRELAQRTGHALLLRVDPALAPVGWKLEVA